MFARCATVLPAVDDPHEAVRVERLVQAGPGVDVGVVAEPAALVEHERALVLVRVRLGVRARDQVDPRRVLVPAGARVELADARGVVRRAEPVERGRRDVAVLVHEVAHEHELALHLRDRRGREQRLRARRDRIAGEQRDQRLEVVAVVVEQLGLGVARVIARRRDAVERGHDLVDHREHRGARVRGLGGDLLAGRRLPYVVELEQPAHRHAVARCPRASRRRRGLCRTSGTARPRGARRGPGPASRRPRRSRRASARPASIVARRNE